MKVLLDKIAVSVVRTVTPWVVGFLVTLLAKAGLEWKPSPEAFLITSQVVSAVFYTIVRIAEVHLSPVYGWLIGAKGAPKYVVPTDETDEAQIAL